ncbi:MAG: AlbA family DNA-binding domain-containing protein, partial [Streptosporangiaceae bacterium]
MADDKQLPERIVRELLSLQSETAGVDFKRGFDGSKKAKGELINCLRAFANSKDGGYIVFGVAEKDGKFVPEGLLSSEIAALDTTKIADLASKYCSELPQFTVHRIELE